MTDFQMSLIAAGGVFVVGVITYNKWQEHKARKSVERAFASDHDDVLMRADGTPAERSEPVLDVGATPGGKRSSRASARRRRPPVGAARRSWRGCRTWRRRRRARWRPPRPCLA
jgi:hypothetical protein